MKNYIIFFSFLFFSMIWIVVIVNQVSSDKSNNQSKNSKKSYSLIEKRLQKISYIQKIPEGESVKYDIRYATPNNFMKKNVYGDFVGCYLHTQAKEKLIKAIEYLKEKKQGYKMLIFDCLRPRSIQRILYEYVQGTPEQKYVANPDKGSIHSYGFAIDLSLMDENNQELDMGTEYDNFTEVAEPQKEAELLKENKITQQQLDNRLLLRKVMEKAGFKVLDHEWWHFEALDAKTVRSQYKIVE